MPDLPFIPKRANWIENRIHKSLMEQRAEKDARFSEIEEKRIYASGLGGCPRKVWADANRVPDERPPADRMLVLFDLGDAVERHVIELLRTAGFEVSSEDPHALHTAPDKQWAVRGFDGQLRARLDGKIKLKPEDPWMVLEIKSAKQEDGTKKYAQASSFEALERAGDYQSWNPKYGAQVQVCMGLSGLESCLVVVECKNDSRLWCEIVRFDEEWFNHLMAVGYDALTLELPPEKPEEAKNKSCEMCKWCGVKEWCWGSTAGVRFDD